MGDNDAPGATGQGYAKGRQRRRQILDAALELYARSPGQRVSLRSIAQASGVSLAGVLHHFPGRDELLVSVLRERDEQARSRYDLTDDEQVWAYLDSTTRTPGLVRLFVDMSVAAADPDHPAAEFMRGHREAVTGVVARLIGTDDPHLVRSALAAAEGVQLQWLRGETEDVVTDLRGLAAALRSARPGHE